jgi:hypothetical protein
MKRIRGTRKEHEARRGGALVLSLAAVVGVLVLATTFTQIASSVSSRQAQAAHRKQAFYMAEAGLAEAYAALVCGRSGVVGSAEAPAGLGDGLFWVEVEADAADPDLLSVTSTGMVGSGSATLSIVVRRGETPVAALGVFSGQALELPAGSTIDAYDSSKADYDSTTDHSGAQLGADGPITLGGTLLQPTTVDGDVTPGPEDVVTDTDFVTVTGSSDPAFSSTTLPPVAVPELTLGDPIKHSSTYPLVLPSGRGAYSMLAVAAGSQVVVEGPAVLVLGDLVLAADSELVLDSASGAIQVYVTGDLDLASGSWLTVTATDPSQTVVQVATEQAEGDSPLVVASQSEFHGVLYAPAATLQVGSGFEVFGSLVADALDFPRPVDLHFDTYLATAALAEQMPSLVSWWIVDLENEPSVASNPFDRLGVVEAALPRPADALEDQWLVIDYYDFSGVYHTYAGLESGFDWSLVKGVIEATRDGEEVVLLDGNLRTGTAKSPGVAPIIDVPL